MAYVKKAFGSKGKPELHMAILHSATSLVQVYFQRILQSHEANLLEPVVVAQGWEIYGLRAGSDPLVPAETTTTVCMNINFR